MSDFEHTEAPAATAQNGSSWRGKPSFSFRRYNRRYQQTMAWSDPAEQKKPSSAPCLSVGTHRCTGHTRAEATTLACGQALFLSLQYSRRNTKNKGEKKTPLTTVTAEQ